MIGRRLLQILLAALVAGAALAPAPATAQPENDQLKLARYNFDYGDYQKTIELVEALQERKQLAEAPELIEAWRLLGLSNFYLGRGEDSRSAFVRLLMIEPDYSLDPVLVPPMAVVLFEQIKEDNEASLAPIREVRRTAAEQRRREEEARQRLLEEEDRRRRERESGPMVVQRVERHNFLTNFLPFGAAQLDQGRGRLGAILAVAQGLTLATSALSYSQVHQSIGSDGKVARSDLESARTWRLVNWISTGAAASLYLAGLIDAVVHFREETHSLTVMPRESLAPLTAPGGPAGDDAPADDSRAGDSQARGPRRPAPSRGSTMLFLSPVPGGAAAGLTGTF